MKKVLIVKTGVALPIAMEMVSILRVIKKANAGVAQLVERQPSKLNVAGSNPVSRSNFPAKAGISLIKEMLNTLRRRSSGVERFLGKEEATGSNPVVGSKQNKAIATLLNRLTGNNTNNN